MGLQSSQLKLKYSEKSLKNTIEYLVREERAVYGYFVRALTSSISSSAGCLEQIIGFGRLSDKGRH